MNEPHRIVAGLSANGPGDIASLAFAIAQDAKPFGFRVLSIKSSRAVKAANAARGSRTKYVHLADKLERCWIIRVSDHYRPRRAVRHPLHFDLVALDGKSGQADVREWLASVARGEVAWVQPIISQNVRKSRQRWKGRRQ
jgi:hypothetical protein